MSTAEPKEPAQPPPRPPRPNYGRIHAKPLPLDTFPLPPLIPHNPLSLLHIAYVYISHLLTNPSSHPKTRIRGWYDALSNSVHVTEEAEKRFLWERGFFGKGSLSRSEPTWLDREKKRLGLLGTDTSEEYTEQRRRERRRLKMERAKKEREAIEETLQREAQAEADRSSEPTAVSETATLIEEQLPQESEALGENGRSAEVHQEHQVDLDDLHRGIKALTVDETTGQPLSDPTEPAMPEASVREVVDVKQQEHLQLCSEESFFLVYALGVVDALDPASQLPISTSDLLTKFRSNSYFPPLPPSDLTPYDPFFLSYVTYHHFRSLGWCVRPGIKFAVDWLLYLRGPAFAHAEFAVIILPAFRHDYWWENSRAEETRKRSKRDWWWLHCLQRVQAQVRKGLVICWVEIPPPDGVEKVVMSSEDKDAAKAKGLSDGDIDIGAMLKKYKVRDMTVKRWIPNRSRD